MDAVTMSIPAAEHSVTAASINEAKQLFKAAAGRLLSISEWNRWCAGLSAMFRLSDTTGRVLTRKARPHDLVQIGDESFELSRLVTFRKPSGKAESIALEVSADGAGGVELFEIKRYNNVVTAIARPEIHQKLSLISPLEWSTLVKRLLSLKNE